MACLKRELSYNCTYSSVMEKSTNKKNYNPISNYNKYQENRSRALNVAHTCLGSIFRAHAHTHTWTGKDGRRESCREESKYKAPENITKDIKWALGFPDITQALYQLSYFPTPQVLLHRFLLKLLCSLISHSLPLFLLCPLSIHPLSFPSPFPLLLFCFFLGRHPLLASTGTRHTFSALTNMQAKHSCKK